MNCNKMDEWKNLYENLENDIIIELISDIDRKDWPKKLSEISEEKKDRILLQLLEEIRSMGQDGLYGNLYFIER